MRRRWQLRPKHSGVELTIEPHSQRLARPVVARTAGRGRGRRHSVWPMVRCKPEMCRGCSTPALPRGKPHALGHGATEEIPYFKKQERLTFARVGITDPRSLSDYIAHGGYRGLQAALAMSQSDIVAGVTASGLRGRGGAAFPAGIKWKTVLGAQAEQKYVVCNADEGDSGTFSDRMLMEGDPFVLIEGMTIAGLATGATHGYIYLRWEYPAGQGCARSGHRRSPCGALPGREHPWQRPVASIWKFAWAPAPTSAARKPRCWNPWKASAARFDSSRRCRRSQGLFGKPTVINNVITFASVPIILDRGADYYQHFGMGRSRGTLPMQLAGNIKHGGLVEIAFGMTLRELLYDFGGGSLSGRPIRAVQVGGPLGAYLPESQFDTPLDYEAFAAVKGMLGHGGIVVFDDSVDMAAQARYAMEFCAIESCGKCTPCRIGSTRGVEVIDRLVAGENARQARSHVARFVRDIDLRLAVRARRPDPVSGAFRVEPFR